MKNFFTENNVNNAFDSKEKLAEIVGMLKVANSVRNLLMIEMEKRGHKDEFLDELFSYLNCEVK